ncbi:MAG: DNA methyltransferase [bacterium]
MKTTHTCVIGDSRKMNEVQDSSVHLIVTSPPYWQLKDYGTESQIGFNDSYEEYINNLNLVWNECNRVLHPGCRMLINIGDQFARSVYYGRYKVIPIRTEIIKFCESIGFDYMGAIIWQKKTTMNTTGGATVMGSFPFPRNGIVEIDYEFILIFKKPGQAPKVSKSTKEQSRIPKEKWKEYFCGHWYFNGAKQDNHIAMFPVELPKRAIEMFTFVGETVLDPFLGSGTTSLAAIITNRNSIGYEINKEFLPVIKEKLNAEKNTLFSDFELHVREQALQKIDWKSEIEKLPYTFSDPVRFDKKVDPKKLKFGSKISVADGKAGAQREQYYTVKQILAANLIKLSNDLVVRLIGVKPSPGKYEAAITFLTNKVLRRQVFLKFDQTKYDEKNNLMAYVYMKNKTFINAHLLKYGFAEIDAEFPFKYKDKFQKLRQANVIYEN